MTESVSERRIRDHTNVYPTRLCLKDIHHKKIMNGCVASHNPLSNRGVRNKPWKARVKVDWVEQFLGYYATKEEAEQVEREFRASK